MLVLLIAWVLAADSSAGATTYKAECSACHGNSGNGKGPAAMALTPKPTDFTAAAFQEKTDAQISAAIRAGKPGTAMSSYPQLTDAQLADLVAYIRTFKQ
jgi:high-affinity iron transporter